ncbi:MAG: 2-phospho-L-lactate guanylyltransferase [Thermomicrobiales bacterium]
MSQPAAVIPLRDGRHGKSRLAPGFDEARRSAMIAAMARHVVEVALAAPSIGDVIVVTRDRSSVQDLLGDLPATVIEQPESSAGLNGALAFARHQVMSGTANGMLILHADLPLLGPADIEEILDQPADVVIAADRHHVGTNALLLRWDRAVPPSVAQAESFRFHFDEESFRAHLAEALANGLTPATVLQPGTELDLDTLGDWNLLPPDLRQELDPTLPPSMCRAGFAAALSL